MQKRNNTRGQLTIFIIIAIILLTTIILIITLRNSTSDLQEQYLNNQQLTTQQQITRDNIFNCIESTTQNAINRISLQGGYANPPENQEYYDLKISFFPYYYNQGSFQNPTQEQIESSLSTYINTQLSNCWNSREYPLTTQFTTVNTQTTIRTKEVIFTIDSIISITENDTTTTLHLQDEQFSQPSKLQGAIHIADYLTNYHKTDPKYYCLNCLSKVANAEELNVDIFPFIENNTIQVVITENQTNNNIFMFVYLNKYTGNEKSETFDDN